MLLMELSKKLPIQHDHIGTRLVVIRESFLPELLQMAFPTGLCKWTKLEGRYCDVVGDCECLRLAAGHPTTSSLL